MNIKEYISSGVIESCVLGLATETEKQEFDAVCQQYPEVADARQQFEVLLEAQALQGAVPPPVFLKEKILASVSNTGTLQMAEEATDHEAPVRRMGFLKILAAASVAALIGVLIWAISLNNKYQSLQQQNAALSYEVAQTASRLTQMEQDAQMMQTPTVKMAAMQGTAIAPQAFATVYWDTTSKNVYMMINNLPQPASDKQYQLWALIDGKPVDLGVFDVKQKQLLVKMKNVQNAQAFAVTLEPRGGSPSPTMKDMYVMGKL